MKRHSFAAMLVASALAMNVIRSMVARRDGAGGFGGAGGGGFGGAGGGGFGGGFGAAGGSAGERNWSPDLWSRTKMGMAS